MKTYKSSRWQFIATLFGLSATAKAQQWAYCEDTKLRGAGISRRRDPEHGCYGDHAIPEKARNNQCPVCGIMAEPYHPNKQFCGDIMGGDPNSFGIPGCQPNSTITRCKRCNAAFWQDAEVKRG